MKPRTFYTPILLTLLLTLLLTTSILVVFVVSPIHAQSEPAIVQISDNRTEHPNQAIPINEKFEITFQVTTSATHPQFPYDSNPPNGLIPSQGISVDAIFTDPQGVSYIQPAFYFQGFEYQVKQNKDWLYPTEGYAWKVRLAPDQVGQWQYRLKAEDQNGLVHSSVQTFTVASGTHPGFIQVSPDARYFQHSNGLYFPALGYNMNYNHVSWENPIQENQANFQIMQANGIQLARIWLSQWSIFGTEWQPWRIHYGNGYLPNNLLSLEEAGPGSDIVTKFDTSGWDKCIFNAWETPAPPLKPNTAYQIDIKYKAKNSANYIKLPGYESQPHGLVLKLGGWLWDDNDWTKRCYTPGNGTIISPHVNSDTSDWQILSGTFNSGDSDFMGRLYIVAENMTVANPGDPGANFYIERISVREIVGNNAFGPNIIQKPTFDQHTYFDQRNAYAFDLVLDLAHQHDVYFTIVLHEKNDWIFNRIDDKGILSNPTANNNANFYGPNRTVNKTRWLQQAYWRYVQARWGYSPNIHSWELLNEGDPNDKRHHNLADEFGKYMHCRVFDQAIGTGDAQNCNHTHPNKHLVSTSMWSTFPGSNFWNNPNYPNLDYADIHEYLDGKTDVAAYHNSLSLLYGARQPQGANKPLIRGETGLSDEVLADTQGIWLHNLVWSQIDSGGLIESYWYDTAHIYNQSRDLRPIFKTYFDFIKTVPLNNEQYQPLGATTSDPNLRAWGQKDLRNYNAHLWVQNKNHHFRNVINTVGVSPVNDTVTIAGFQPNTQYALETWDTYVGTVATTTITSTITGTLSLTINNLTDDRAFKIVNQSPIDLTETATPTPTPLSTATPHVTATPHSTATPLTTPTVRPFFSLHLPFLVDER
ncbi:MAG: hypothetical protein AAF702_31225 [Chloroflexota bacterium]